MKVSTFRLPETFNYDGNVNMLTDVEAINQCLKVLFQVNRGELFGDSNFGSILYNSRYTSNSDIIKDILKDSILSMISRYDHRIEVTELSLTIDDVRIHIDLSYAFLSMTSTLGINIIREN